MKCINTGCDRKAGTNEQFCCRPCFVSMMSWIGPWDIEPYDSELDDGSLAYQLHHHTRECKDEKAKGS